MSVINENDLAVKVAHQEGGRVSLPIGQVKEVMRLVLEELAGLLETGKHDSVMELIMKHGRASRKK